jgi:hypothetical protein
MKKEGLSQIAKQAFFAHVFGQIGETDRKLRRWHSLPPRIPME